MATEDTMHHEFWTREDMRAMGRTLHRLKKPPRRVSAVVPRVIALIIEVGHEPVPQRPGKVQDDSLRVVCPSEHLQRT